MQKSLRCFCGTRKQRDTRGEALQTQQIQSLACFPRAELNVDTGNPNLIQAVQRKKRVESNPSWSDLNHICRWFEKATQAHSDRISCGILLFFFSCLFSQSPHNSLTSSCNGGGKKKKKDESEFSFQGFSSYHPRPESTNGSARSRHLASPAAAPSSHHPCLQPVSPRP